MIDTMMNWIKVLKEFKWLLMFAFGSSGLSMANWEYVIGFNLHVVLAVFIFGFLVYHILYTQIKELRVEMNETQKQQNIQRLKATVDRTYKDFKDIEVIDFDHSIKYILELEDERVKLGVNSHTEYKLSVLLGKIDMSKG